jgi:hypothetical protein
MKNGSPRTQWYKCAIGPILSRAMGGVTFPVPWDSFPYHEFTLKTLPQATEKNRKKSVTNVLSGLNFSLNSLDNTIIGNKRVGGVVQVVEHLLCKLYVPSSKPSPTKRK